MVGLDGLMVEGDEVRVGVVAFIREFFPVPVDVFGPEARPRELAEGLTVVRIERIGVAGVDEPVGFFGEVADEVLSLPAIEALTGALGALAGDVGAEGMDVRDIIEGSGHRRKYGGGVGGRGGFLSQGLVGEVGGGFGLGGVLSFPASSAGELIRVDGFGGGLAIGPEPDHPLDQGTVATVDLEVGAGAGPIVDELSLSVVVEDPTSLEEMEDDLVGAGAVEAGGSDPLFSTLDPFFPISGGSGFRIPRGSTDPRLTGAGDAPDAADVAGRMFGEEPFEHFRGRSGMGLVGVDEFGFSVRMGDFPGGADDVLP